MIQHKACHRGVVARTSEGDGVDILAVVRHGHVFLTEANRIFALGNAIKLFELFLRNALQLGEE